jgi:hypothetical protein
VGFFPGASIAWKKIKTLNTKEQRITRERLFVFFVNLEMPS